MSRSVLIQYFIVELAVTTINNLELEYKISYPIPLIPRPLLGIVGLIFWFITQTRRKIVIHARTLEYRISNFICFTHPILYNPGACLKCRLNSKLLHTRNFIITSFNFEVYIHLESSNKIMVSIVSISRAFQKVDVFLNY